MKKAVVFIFALCIMFCMPITAFADNVIVGTNAIDEDLDACKESIFADYYQNILGENRDYRPSDADIMYDKAVRVYWDMPFIESDELTRAQMQEFASLSAYAYYIPVKCNDDNASLIVTKSFYSSSKNRYNLDISGKFNKFYFKEDAGWHMQSVDFKYYYLDCIKSVNELLYGYGIDNSDVYFVNSIGGLTKNVLVIFRENSNTAEFIILDDVLTHQIIVPNTELGRKTYTYSEIKEFDNSQQNSYAFIAVLVLISVLAVVVTIIFVNRRFVK